MITLDSAKRYVEAILYVRCLQGFKADWFFLTEGFEFCLCHFIDT